MAAARSMTERLTSTTGLLLILILTILLFWFTAPNFASQANFLNIVRQASFVGIAAMAMTLVIISGEIDLSIGSNVAFTSAMLGVLAVDNGWTEIGAVAAVILIGVIFGSAAGILRAKLNVPSFIATLALYLALRGGAEAVSQQRTLAMRGDLLRFFNGVVLGVPFATWILLIAFVSVWFISRKTTFGRSVYAVGGNAKAARLSGLRVDLVRVAVFAISGAFAAIVGILQTARVQSSTSIIGYGFEFEAIAAVVIGGTSFAGGRGSVVGTLIGGVFVTVIANALVLYGASSSVQDIVRGVIVLVAVILSILQVGGHKVKD